MTNRNRCSCRCASAISSLRLFVRETLFRAAACHRAASLSQPTEDVEGFRAFLATLVGPAQEMNSANLLKPPFGPETLLTENDRALRESKDPQSNPRWQRPRGVGRLSVQRRRTEDFESENANRAGLR